MYSIDLAGRGRRLVRQPFPGLWALKPSSPPRDGDFGVLVAVLDPTSWSAWSASGTIVDFRGL